MEISEKLEKIIDKENIYLNESMKKHTSFKIGGNADVFVYIKTEEINIRMKTTKIDDNNSDALFFITVKTVVNALVYLFILNNLKSLIKRSALKIRKSIFIKKGK